MNGLDFIEVTWHAYKQTRQHCPESRIDESVDAENVDYMELFGLTVDTVPICFQCSCQNLERIVRNFTQRDRFVLISATLELIVQNFIDVVCQLRSCPLRKTMVYWHVNWAGSLRTSRTMMTRMAFWRTNRLKKSISKISLMCPHCRPYCNGVTCAKVSEIT